MTAIQDTQNDNYSSGLGMISYLTNKETRFIKQTGFMG